MCNRQGGRGRFIGRQRTVPCLPGPAGKFLHGDRVSVVKSNRLCLSGLLTGGKNGLIEKETRSGSRRDRQRHWRCGKGLWLEGIFTLLSGIYDADGPDGGGFCVDVSAKGSICLSGGRRQSALCRASEFFQMGEGSTEQFPGDRIAAAACICAEHRIRRGSVHFAWQICDR